MTPPNTQLPPKIRYFYSNIRSGLVLHVLLYVLSGVAMIGYGWQADYFLLFFLGTLMIPVSLFFLSLYAMYVSVSENALIVRPMSGLFLKAVRFDADQIAHVQLCSHRYGDRQLYEACAVTRNNRYFAFFRGTDLDTVRSVARQAGRLLSRVVLGEHRPAYPAESVFVCKRPGPFRLRLDAPKIPLLIILPVVTILVVYMNSLRHYDALYTEQRRIYTAFSKRMASAIQRAEKISQTAAYVPKQEQRTIGKVVVHFPDKGPSSSDGNYLYVPKMSKRGVIVDGEDGWTTLGNINAEDISTVVLVRTIDNDWGSASGEVILLDTAEQFGFSVSSGVTKKQLTTEIEGDWYVYDYLDKLTAVSKTR